MNALFDQQKIVPCVYKHFLSVDELLIIIENSYLVFCINIQTSNMLNYDIKHSFGYQFFRTMINKTVHKKNDPHLF